MTEDAQDLRRRARDDWERAAEGWSRDADWWDRASRPVTEWMIEAIAPRPGHTVLELAAGPGDVGLLVAELVRPGGRVLVTDGAEPMIEIARRRAVERSLDDVVEARTMEAEWIDLPTASVDAVACRWGYMLLADPDAALREARRVLRPGGVLTLAAWDGPEANPWASVPTGELVRRGLADAVAPSPGQFAWQDRDAIAERLADAGFLDVAVDTVAFTIAYPDLDVYWQIQVDRSTRLRTALANLDPATRDEVMEASQRGMARFATTDGAVRAPAAAHVARAEA